MNKKDIIKQFLLSRDVKEIVTAHVLIALLSSVVYTISEFYGVVMFASLMFLELVVFHVLWIYRDNPEKENRLRYALKQEFVNLVIGGTGALILLVIVAVVSKITGISFLFPFVLVLVILFVLYSISKTNKLLNKVVNKYD